MNALPPVQQYLYRQVSILRSGDLVERLQAIKAMGKATALHSTHAARSADCVQHTAADTHRQACACVCLHVCVCAVEAGDDVVVPELAKCLHDKDLMDIAYEAMWKLFMRQ